jgi:hypothetical protein
MKWLFRVMLFFFNFIKLYGSLQIILERSGGSLLVYIFLNFIKWCEPDAIRRCNAKSEDLIAQGFATLMHHAWSYTM